MGILDSLTGWIEKKKREIDDRKRFLDQVERETKPIKRAAYLEEMKKKAVLQGKEKAIKDFEKTSTMFSSGLSEGLQDPYKYINSEEKKNGKSNS